MFVQRIAVLALLLALCPALPATAAGPELIDIVPANAVQFVGINSTRSFSQKLDKIITGVDPQQPGIAAFYDIIINQMGLGNALDRNAPVGILLASPQDVLGKPLGRDASPDQMGKLVVGNLGYTNEAKLAQDLRIDPQQLKPDTFFNWKSDNFPVPLKALYHEGRLYLSAEEKAIQSVRKAATLRERATKSEVAALLRCDALMLLNPEQMTDAWKEGLKTAGPVMPREGPLRTTLEELNLVVLGARLEDGVEAHLLGQFPKDSASGRLLANLGAGGASNLRGLPDRPEVLFAEASAGAGPEAAGLAKLLASLDLPGGLGLSQLVPAAQRPAVQEQLAALWKPLRGDRFALYTPRNPRLGQFAALALLESDRPADFLAELAKRTQAGQPGTLKFAPAEADVGRATIEQFIKDLGAEDFDTREKAAMRLLALGRNALPYLEPAAKSMDAEVARRARDLIAEINLGTAARRNDLLQGRNAFEALPTLTLYREVEKRREQAVAALHLKLQPQDAALEPKLRDLFGPDWDRLRVVALEKHVIVLLGSDVSLLEDAIDRVSRNEAGLDASALLKGLSDRVGTARKVELHLPLVRWMLMIDPKLGEAFGEADRKGLTTVVLSPSGERLQIDAWMPLTELRGLVQTVQRLTR